MSVELDDLDRTEWARQVRVRRWLVGALVVACLAGPLAGFALARAGTDDATTEVAAGTRAASGRDATASGVVAPGVAAAVGLERLFTRTTTDGVTIRAYRSAVPAAPAVSSCPTGAPCPFLPCAGPPVGTAAVLGELSTDAAVTTVSGSATSDPGNGAAGIATTDWGTFGEPEAAPARWAIASVGDAVTRVRVAFPGGTTDEMEPVDGVVLLASRVDDPLATGARLEALDHDGTVVDSVDLTPGGGSTASAASGSGPEGAAGSSSESSAQVQHGGLDVVARRRPRRRLASSSAAASSVSSSSVSSSSPCLPTGPDPAPFPPPTPRRSRSRASSRPTSPRRARPSSSRTPSPTTARGPPTRRPRTWRPRPASRRSRSRRAASATRWRTRRRRRPTSSSRARRPRPSATTSRSPTGRTSSPAESARRCSSTGGGRSPGRRSAPTSRSPGSPARRSSVRAAWPASTRSARGGDLAPPRRTRSRSRGSAGSRAARRGRPGRSTRSPATVAIGLVLRRDPGSNTVGSSDRDIEYALVRAAGRPASPRRECGSCSNRPTGSATAS